MEFNVAKCFILSITLAKKHKIVNNYTMGGETLTITSNTKYLGVTISSDLKWNILPVTVIQSTTTESFKIQLQATHTI